MAAQLFLITPVAADPQTFPATLMGVLASAEVSAILVRRGDRDDAAYTTLARAVVNVGQGAGCAVLVEDDLDLAKRLGADGVHVTAGPAAVAEAAAALKPAMIVGAGGLASRHDAMTIGEMDVDYVFFGPLDGTADTEAADLAAWWAETFEVPAVFSDPAATPETVDSQGAEFLALSTSIWAAATPGPALAAIAAALE
ncbi:hypothetical protein VW29_01920 [Devosia limi DSM 17137]|uniref:Thiamine-phosphate pyrophosphorylase n=1 Tax=Devosia limi DSM 17137 TaxID=1121477 RepID=A0A0F5LVP7_9HYPH|nr:thiamine phosphate synthase [Devosia limi]KKB86361.1 hypothetical protein VW29_01920 [Devosia limi DSM 17137]SHE92343.1 thiamine-phosphate pyrophosphorylase [Devosia limi DSM 17137]